MAKYRVISPLLHDWHPYAIGEEIDGDILSEGQAEQLVIAGALQPIEDEAPAESEPEPEAEAEAEEPETEEEPAAESEPEA